MRILITGSNGFLARHLAKYFSSLGNTTIGLQRKISSAHSCDEIVVTNYEEDLTSIVSATHPDVIIHSAGAAEPTKSLSKPHADFLANVQLHHRIISAVAVSKLRPKFINLSSAAVYGEPKKLPISECQAISPISPYGIHKYLTEDSSAKYWSLCDIPTVNLRIFSAYGPFLKKQVIWTILEKMRTSEKIQLFGTGNESRDFIYAEDICLAVAIIIESAQFIGESYNVASGEELSIRDLATELATAMKFEGEINFDHQPELGKPLKWKACIQKIQRLGFAPQWRLNDGINETIKWFQQNRMESSAE